jgi:DNA-binding Xre family transcriptional regulator
MITSNLRRIAKEKGMTARDIIKITGLSSTTLTKARQDKGISECRLSTLGRIAKALGVTTKELYDEQPDA